MSLGNSIAVAAAFALDIDVAGTIAAVAAEQVVAVGVVEEAAVVAAGAALDLSAKK